jgi:RimJ/RimL family protein N-acetyltransferase
MKVEFRKANYETPADSLLLAKWFASPDIRFQCQPHFEENQPLSTAKEIQDRSQKTEEALELMILLDGETVGHCDLKFNPPHCLTKEGKVGWIGITIGEASARGKGVGKQVLRHLEELAIAENATACEAGAFEFNGPSLALLRSQGYEQIGRIENFTYFRGKRWADIRFLKKFRP